MTTTGLQLAMLGGVSVGAGLSLAVWRLAPNRPDALDAVRRLSGEAMTAARTPAGHRPEDWTDVLGRWGMKRLPVRTWGVLPARELALLRMSQTHYYGQKLTFALLGLVIPPVLGTVFAVAGWRQPVVVPVLGSLVLAVAMFFIPNLNVRDDASRARAEFVRAVAAYTELIALERNGGAGTRQAMEQAATVGDSWVFARLREELAFSRWSGEPPWEALNRLAAEVGVAELGDLADILRLSGEEGSQIYAQLRARSASQRASLLAQELTHANAVGEKLTIPMSALGVVFLTILIVPALLRIVGIT